MLWGAGAKMNTRTVAVLVQFLFPLFASSSSDDESYARRLASMSEYNPEEGIDPSFYSGLKPDGNPLSDEEGSWNSSDDSEFPEIPCHLLERHQYSPMDRFRKPLNEDSIRSQNIRKGTIDPDTWASIQSEFMSKVVLNDNSGTESEGSWSVDESNLTEKPEFYSGFDEGGIPSGITEATPMTYDPSLEGLEKESIDDFKSSV